MTLSPKLGMSEIITLWTFQTPFANTDIYKSSFFPQTIRDWNSLTDSVLSAAEGVEDSVLLISLFLQELGTNFPDHRSWWMIVIWTYHQYQFWFW